MHIRNLNKLSASLTNIHSTKICESCLKRFSTQKAYESERHKCNYNNDIDLPDNMFLKDNKLLKCPIDMYVKPYNLKHNQFPPWIMYCDFESILVPIKDPKYDNKYEHKLSSYCYNLVYRERPSFDKFKVYRGKMKTAKLLINVLMILKIY